jgi:hypothetical protein
VFRRTAGAGAAVSNLAERVKTGGGRAIAKTDNMVQVEATAKATQKLQGGTSEFVCVPEFDVFDSGAAAGEGAQARKVRP